MSDVMIIVTTETASALDRARAKLDECPAGADYAATIEHTLLEAGVEPFGDAEIDVLN